MLLNGACEPGRAGQVRAYWITWAIGLAWALWLARLTLLGRLGCFHRTRLGPSAGSINPGRAFMLALGGCEQQRQLLLFQRFFVLAVSVVAVFGQSRAKRGPKAGLSRATAVLQKPRFDSRLESRLVLVLIWVGI